ncbi:hypothetical protein HRR83_003535 [Exophiala dermatitidis]|uniref:Uncharacterized protein n=1 Tax=Exophiala dermatitidis TaxID=5970 RepID=A0AAN6J0A5_EXODE|nr:hypothetical protein HRR74_003088 [Exophiala dermatitidis]KAJ4529828.1 hypothetical protein HRR73_000856 [Exophiala dermatitidis]KAJ4543005.1 hypothetical protein HRR77_005267 [Exophiala dermatitidis]KAJ4543506.1 hypothetical protein HRR76_001575 [Exophiala dermatitidis]KAJ4574970.1 hypothetical protein HRR79_001905 [Exophiala dermatitidis]
MFTSQLGPAYSCWGRCGKPGSGCRTHRHISTPSNGWPAIITPQCGGSSITSFKFKLMGTRFLPGQPFTAEPGRTPGQPGDIIQWLDSVDFSLVVSAILKWVYRRVVNICDFREAFSR